MPQAFNYTRVTATGVSTISISQFGMLHAIVLNQQSTAASTAANNFITIYNATTTAVAPFIVGVAQANNSGVGDYIYDALCSAGLTINVGSAVNPVDITVTFT